jgi:hypothetical protein
LSELWPSGLEFLAVLTIVDSFYDCDEALSLMTKLDKNVALLKNAMRKLQLWLNFSAAQQCNGNECCGNFTPTRLFI